MGPILDLQKIFSLVLPPLLRHCLKLSSYNIFKKILINQTWRNGKKPDFEPTFGLFEPNLGPQNVFLWVLPLLVARHCSNTSYHLMQFPGKLMNQTSENGKKRNFGPDFGPFGPNLGLARNCSKSKLSSYAI